MGKTMVKYDAEELLDLFSDTLCIVIKGDNAYVVDTYRQGDEEYDYGIYSVVPVSSLRDGSFGIDNVPEFYVDGFIDFLLDDDLVNHFNIDKKIVNSLRDVCFCKWYDELVSRGVITKDNKDNFELLENLCPLFGTDAPNITSISDERIDILTEQSKESNIMFWVDKYIAA